MSQAPKTKPETNYLCSYEKIIGKKIKANYFSERLAMLFKNYIVKRGRDTDTFIFRKLGNGPSERPLQ